MARNGNSMVVAGGIITIFSAVMISPHVSVNFDDAGGLVGYRERMYCYAGLPTSTNDLTMLLNRGYVIGYSESKGVPLWACYRVSPSNSEAPDRPSNFRSDLRVQKPISSGRYDGIGYDRGHMAPSYAVGRDYGDRAQRETFLMSNVVPQKPQMNRGPWKSLEYLAASKWAQSNEVWVTVGGVFTGEVTRIDTDGPQIPDACFFVVLREANGESTALAFLVGQDVSITSKPGDFSVSIDEIESLTGLDLFSGLPDDKEKRLESSRQGEIWQ